MTVRPDDWVLVTGGGHRRLTRRVTAEPTSDGFVHVRVWLGASRRTLLAVQVEDVLRIAPGDHRRRAAVLARQETVSRTLIAADAAVLAHLLTEDFLGVGVISGGVTDRSAFLETVASNEVRFINIVRDPAEAVVRICLGVAIVIGRTETTTQVGPDTVITRGRYTHEFAEEDRRWRLLNPQETQVSDQPANRIPQRVKDREVPDDRCRLPPSRRPWSVFHNLRRATGCTATLRGSPLSTRHSTAVEHRTGPGRIVVRWPNGGCAANSTATEVSQP